MPGLYIFNGKTGYGFNIFIPFVDFKISVKKIKKAWQATDQQFEKLVLPVIFLNPVLKISDHIFKFFSGWFFCHGPFLRILRTLLLVKRKTL